MLNRWRQSIGKGREPDPAKETAESKPRIKALVLAGQSNMLGHGRVEAMPADYRKMPPRVTLVQQAWEHDGTFLAQNQTKTFGPEVSFAHEIVKAWPDEEVLLIKFAVGGTSILAWLPDAPEQDLARLGNALTGPLFSRLVTFVDDASRQYSAEVMGFIWTQGRRDAALLETAVAYGEHLHTFVWALREHWQQPLLPFVFSQAPAPSAERPLAMAELLYRFPYITELRQQQRLVEPEIPPAKMVKTDDLNPDQDYIYFDTASEIKLGHRLARAYLALLHSDTA